MMKFILNNPISCALIFIVLFELFFQHYFTLLTYLICTYFVLKSLGLTDIIKRFLKKIMGFLFNKHLDTLKKNMLDVELMFKDENGVLEARFYFQKNKMDYLASVTKTPEKITIWLFGDDIENPIKFEDEVFYVTKASIVNYLEKKYFEL